jgi:replication-associated recombination protein RarA
VKSWNIWANGADEKWEVHAAMKCMRRCEELYRSLIKGKLLLGSMGLKLAPEHISKLIQMAMRCDDNFDNSQGNLADIIKCLQTPGQAVKGLDIALKSLDFHAPIYCVLAILNLKMGIKQVSIQVDKYLQQLLASTDDHDYIDPMLYYVYYLTWRKCGSNSKSDRVRAAFALTALRCFPVFAKNWVDVDDDIDAIVKAEGLMEEDEVGGRGRGGMGNSSAFRKICPVDMDDNHDELDEEPFTNDSPDAEWQIAKSDHQLRSEGMDQLMALTGLQDIKKKAMEIVKAVLLNKGRPASLKADVAMNFLFTGNPGCGKTTVANLLTRAMNQLGFRKNNTMIETSAQDILKLKNPGTDFADMMKQATGGCLFIDEAYRFSPAPAGQQPNASNEVLDYLLEAIEKPEIRSTTTVILAGYRDEIETLLAYNVGFASRFNREFCFPDYTEVQLCKIFLGMVKDRGFLLERKKDCGVSIGAVMANRIHSGAGKKGFGNAREVRNKVEEVIAKQSDRLGTMMLQKKPVSERDYKLLLAVDSVGVRPDFNRSPTMRQLETMMGLNKVKEHFRNLMDMATQNFDREMRGEKPNLISLHRVFYGNPGTGKTTVSELYGALLKELGYLSKGDFIRVTPADLTGEAEGGAATNTKAVLEKARGKVLLIDEAYVLDPKRKNNIYGGNVLDTLVEKLDGEAGSDCAVILAGYRREMFAMLENNHGLHRRFNIDDFGIFFEDMEDEELRQVLVSGVGKEGLAFSNLLDIDLVLNRIAQKRRMPGFGNAATVNSMINVAKVAKSKRLGEAKKAYDVAIKEGRVPEPLPNPDLLLLSDFIQNEEDAASARNVFANLYNMDHIVEVLDELESIIVQAKADGREPADVLANNHMVFIGPPGTGKTTVAMKFGKLLKDLNILPSDNLTHVTGTSLQGQYIGETKEKVLKAMHQARGGILFIDEAYGLAGGNYSKGTCPYAKEAVETLVGAITEPEFKGNMLVIMAGYEEEIDQMFASVNPGFASRYNKRRVRFLPWTAKQAADAVVEEINKKKEKEGTITDEAICCLFDCCVQMQPLPGSGPTRASWASARDVIELILPALYSQRAKRLVATGKVLAAAGIEKDDGEKAGVSKACLRKSAQVGLVPPPYELADVKLALSPIVASRKKILGYEVYSPPELQVSIPTKSIDEALGGLDPRKAPKVKNKTKIQNYQDEDENGVSDDVIWAALEQTCVDLGYSEEDIVEMLKPGGDYKHDLLARIVQITGCSDMAKIRAVIDRQKHALLVRMEAIMEQRKKQKSEEEKKIQEKIKRIGRCPMDYEWLKVEGGYRCAGGSHFCTDEQIKAFCF